MTATSNHTTTDHTGTGPTPAEARFETLRVKGDELAAQVKDLIHQGNVQRIVVRNSDGHRVIEIPINAGLVAAVVAPVLTGVAAIAALASDWQIEVQRDTDHPVG